METITTIQDVNINIDTDIRDSKIVAMPAKQEENNTEQDTTVTNLVILQNNQAFTTSLKVAEVFGKNHRDVLKEIRTLEGQIEGMRKSSQTPLFQETTYTHEQNGQTYPMYYINRDGFTLLAMGFSGKKALQFKLAYIEAFNRMEAQLKAQQKPMSMAEMLHNVTGELLKHEQKLLQHDKQISELLLNQAALMTYSMRNVLGLKSTDKEQQRQLDKHEEDISSIKKVFTTDIGPREEIKNIVDLAVHNHGLSHQDTYNIVYSEIQKALGVNLGTRVNNIKKRLQKNGASKTKIDAVTKLDAIEQDPTLWKPVREVLKGLREAAVSH